MNEDIFLDIVRKYSVFDYGGPVYVKHLSVIENIEISRFYKEKYELFLSKGKEKDADICKRIIREGKWLAIKEKSIKSCEEDIANLEHTKRSIKDYAQIDGIYNSIEELKAKRLSLLVEKYNIITDSAEITAERATKEFQITKTCFRDVNFTQPLFSDEDLEYLGFHEFLIFGGLYHNVIYSFAYDKLKNLAIEHFIKNIFSLNDKYSEIFDVPALKLTQFQFLMIRAAETYTKASIEESDYPEELEGNAEKILMWYFFKKNGGVLTSDADDKMQLARLEAISRKD